MGRGVPDGTRIWVLAEMRDSHVPAGPPSSGWRRARAVAERMRSIRTLPVAVNPAATRRASSARRRFPPGPVWQRMATLFMRDCRLEERHIVRSTLRGGQGHRGQFLYSIWEQRILRRGDTQRGEALESRVLGGVDQAERMLPHGEGKRKQVSLKPTPPEWSSRMRYWREYEGAQLGDAEHSSLTSPRISPAN